MHFREAIRYDTTISSNFTFWRCLQTCRMVRRNVCTTFWAVCRIRREWKKFMQGWFWRASPVYVTRWKMETDWNNQLESRLCWAWKTINFHQCCRSVKLDQKIHRWYVRCIFCHNAIIPIRYFFPLLLDRNFYNRGHIITLVVHLRSSAYGQTSEGALLGRLRDQRLVDKRASATYESLPTSVSRSWNATLWIIQLGFLHCSLIPGLYWYRSINSTLRTWRQISPSPEIKPEKSVESSITQLRIVRF